MSARRSVHPSALRVAVLLAATAAGACQPRYGRILDPGSGPENEGPVWPLGAGLSWGDDARPAVVAQRDLDEGRLVTVDLAAMGVDLRFVGRRTMDLLETAEGDLVGVEPDGQRYLFVPGTLREGMRFRFELSHPDGSFVSADGAYGELDVGDGVWTAEVVERREEAGRWGDQTLWTIVYTGPPVPHHDGRRDAVPYAADPSSLLVQETTEDEVPRWGAVLELVEGVGPTAFIPGPLGAPLRSAGPRVWTGEAVWDPRQLDAPADPPTPAPTPLPPPLPGPLAGDTPQAAASLEAEPLGVLFEPEGGWFLPRTARYTWSSVEASGGAPGELVLMGTAFGTSTLYDPNGQRIDDFQGATAAICLALDPSGTLRPLDRLAGPCPNRTPDSIGKNAHPYVRPDGRRWDRPDAMKVPETGGSAATGTYTLDAVATEAPFVRDGVQHAVTCGGRGPGGRGLLAAASLQGCQLLSFDEDEPILVSADTVHEDPLQAMAFARQHAASPPFHGARRSSAYDVPGVSHDSLSGSVFAEVVIPELTFAVPFEDRVAYVAVDGGLVASGAIWMDYAGNTLHRELLPLWNPSVSNRDGVYTLSDVSPQGDLRVVHVHPDGLEVELRGRVDLPENHRAVYAIELAEERFLVIAETPGDGEGPGRPVPAVYESNVSAFLAQPAVPPSRLELHGFLVTAPASRGDVDRDWLIRRPTVQRAGVMVRVCEPPLPAGVDAPAPRVRAVRIGGRVVDVDAPYRDAWGCLLLPSTADERATATELGATPVALELEGLGWVTHVVPPPSDELPVRAGRWAALPDGSRRHLDALVFPLGAEEWPVSQRVAEIDVDCWKFDGLSYDACRDHLFYGDFGTDTGSWSGHERRLLVDRGGQGLWAVLDDRWSSWEDPGPGPNEGDGGFALCRPGSGPCLDPLAAEAPPEAYDDGDAPFVRLDERVEAPLWEVPRFTHAAPAGGLVGGGRRLTADGAVVSLQTAGAEAFFRDITQYWTDGSACGYTTANSSFTCLTPSGPWIPYPDSGWYQVDTFVRPLEWAPVDPDLLVTVTPLLARFEDGDTTVATDRDLHVRLLDLGAREERSVRVGSLLPPGAEPSTDDASPLNQPGEARVVGPIAGPDGSVWWSAGPPLSRWVRAGDGQVRTGALPEGTTALWSVGSELLYWEPGLVTTLGETLASGTCEPVDEACNGVDDDCDGVADEDEPGAPLCDATHGEVACVDARCVVASCDPWFDDCDGFGENGCETALGTEDACLGCDDACPLVGGSECAPDGCAPVEVAAVVATTRTPIVLFANGEARVGEAKAGPLLDVAAGLDHYCALDDAGGLACTCEAPPGNDCRAAGVGLSLPEVDRVWAGHHSTCVRTVWGAVQCWGDVASDEGNALPWPHEVPEVAGADEIVFGGPYAGQACARIGGAVSCFGPAQGSGPFEVNAVALPGPVDRLAAGPGFVLYDVGGEVHATGVLWRYPALGGPQTPAVWTTPTRVPGLDGALGLVSGFGPGGEGVPCKLLADRVACPYQPGSPWQTSWFAFDAPAVVRTDEAWVELPGVFQAGVGAGSTLCLVDDDVAGEVRCRGATTFP